MKTAIGIFLLSIIVVSGTVVPGASAQALYEDIAEIVLPGRTQIALIKGDLGYGISEDARLEVYDLSGVFSLNSFTTLSPVGWPVSLPLTTAYSGAIGGDTLYVGGQDGIAVLDIGSSQPVVVKHTPAGTMVRVLVAGTLLIGCEYSHSGTNAVTIWDIGLPHDPVRLGTLTVWAPLFSAVANGNHLYASVGTQHGSATIEVIDLSNPANLSLLASVPVGDGVYDQMKIVDGKLVASLTGVARLFDVATNPVVPALLDSASVAGRVCAVDGKRVIFGDAIHSVGAATLDYVEIFNNHGGPWGSGFATTSDVSYNGLDGIVLLAMDSRALVLRTVVGTPFLVADADRISGSLGGRVNFSLDATAANANRRYLLLGSESGTHPGTLLPGGLATIPLNRDGYTDLVFSLLNTPIFVDFQRRLDASGLGSARLELTQPVPGAVGKTFFFAYCLMAPFDFASNAVPLQVRP